MSIHITKNGIRAKGKDANELFNMIAGGAAATAAAAAKTPVMSTVEMCFELRQMAAQILTPSSKGKLFFNQVADRLEYLEDWK